MKMIWNWISTSFCLIESTIISFCFSQNSKGCNNCKNITKSHFQSVVFSTPTFQVNSSVRKIPFFQVKCFISCIFAPDFQSWPLLTIIKKQAKLCNKYYCLIFLKNTKIIQSNSIIVLWENLLKRNGKGTNLSFSAPCNLSVPFPFLSLRNAFLQCLDFHLKFC